MRSLILVGPPGQRRLAIGSLVFAAGAIFVLFLRSRGFHAGQIVGFSGFTFCLLGLIAVSVSLSLEDRRRDNEIERAARAARATARPNRRGGANSARAQRENRA
jgi:hypothetical protein